MWRRKNGKHIYEMISPSQELQSCNNNVDLEPRIKSWNTLNTWQLCDSFPLSLFICLQEKTWMFSMQKCLRSFKTCNTLHQVLLWIVLVLSGKIFSSAETSVKLSNKKASQFPRDILKYFSLVVLNFSLCFFIKKLSSQLIAVSWGEGKVTCHLSALRMLLSFWQ
jgi:hypothetical protein